MRQSWFENPDNVVYTTIAQFADNFGKEAGIPDLGKQIAEFRENPVPEGRLLKGTKRTAVKLFIPDMVFGKHLDMGENVWVFVGETYPAYCIYE